MCCPMEGVWLVAAEVLVTNHLLVCMKQSASLLVRIQPAMVRIKSTAGLAEAG